MSEADPKNTTQPPRLDQRTIDRALKADRTQGDIELLDHEVRGLRLIVRKARASWFVSYRPTGFADPETKQRHKTRWKRLGEVRSMSLAEARRAALKIKAAAADGRDVKAEEAAKREAAREAERRAKLDAMARLSCTVRLPNYLASLEMRGCSDKHITDETSQIIGALVDMGEMQRPSRRWKCEAPECAIAPAEITPALIDRMLTNAPAHSKRHRFDSLDRFLRWALKGPPRNKRIGLRLRTQQ